MIKFRVSYLLVNNNTHITEKIDEGIVTAVGHGQPMATEPDNIDVLITKHRIQNQQLI